jgi:MspA
VNVDLPLANMALNRSGRAMLDVEAIHVKADGCGGPVSIRSYAYLRISTPDAHTESAVYGDPINI